MKFSQRDMVEVAFPLPNGKVKNHPAIIMSGEELYETEGIFYCVMMSTESYNSQYVFELKPEMVVGKHHIPSYVKCQLVAFFDERHVIKKHGHVTTDAFNSIRKKVIESVF